MHLNAFWIGKWSERISTRNGHHRVHCPIPVCFGVPRRHYRIPEVWKPYQTRGTLLTLLGDPGFMIKLQECGFLCNLINCLVQALHPGQFTVWWHIIEAICELNLPPNITELPSFLSFCNIFWPFAPNSARIAALQNKKPRKDRPRHFETLTDELLVVQTLHQKLINRPMLSFHWSKGTFTMDRASFNHKIRFTRLQQ